MDVQAVYAYYTAFLWKGTLHVRHPRLEKLLHPPKTHALTPPPPTCNEFRTHEAHERHSVLGVPIVMTCCHPPPQTPSPDSPPPPHTHTVGMP